MPVYRKRDINPDFTYINLGKFLSLMIRISKRKRVLEMRKNITIIDEGLHTYKMNTDKFFKDDKKE